MSMLPQKSQRPEVPQVPAPTWHPSKRGGNPTCTYHGYAITVFYRWGAWHACLVENALLGPEWRGPYGSAEEAKEAAAEAVLWQLQDYDAVVE